MAHAAAVLSKLQNAVHRRFQSWCRNEVKPGTGRVLVEVDPRYFRQTEVDDLVDDPIENATPAWLAAPRLIQRACRTDGEARPHVVQSTSQPGWP
jgi:GDP-D-mannose dehydratase